MENREATVHGIYRHFKGKYYIVEGIAKHSETKDPLVVYRQLYQLPTGVNTREFGETRTHS